MTVDELILELGIDKLPAERQEQLLTKVYQALQMRVGNRLAETLTEDQMKQFIAISEKNDDEASVKELSELIPNYDEIVREEIGYLKEDMQALTQH